MRLGFLVAPIVLLPAGCRSTHQDAVGPMLHEARACVDAYNAKKWHQAEGTCRRAAELGSTTGQMHLAFIWSDGEAFLQNFEEAAKWWRRAAEQDEARAQFELARLYVDGKGVPQNFVHAHMWSNLAARSERFAESGAELRRSLEVKMTRAEITEAQKLAAEWKPTDEMRAP